MLDFCFNYYFEWSFSGVVVGAPHCKLLGCRFKSADTCSCGMGFVSIWCHLIAIFLVCITSAMTKKTSTRYYFDFMTISVWVYACVNVSALVHLNFKASSNEQNPICCFYQNNQQARRRIRQLKRTPLDDVDVDNDDQITTSPR